jgi:hypothetical protein
VRTTPPRDLATRVASHVLRTLEPRTVAARFASRVLRAALGERQHSLLSTRAQRVLAVASALQAWALLGAMVVIRCWMFPGLLRARARGAASYQAPRGSRWQAHALLGAVQGDAAAQRNERCHRRCT